MVDILWPSTNNPGAAPNEGSGRLINCYAYKDAGGPRWRPVPGLRSFAFVPIGEWRGSLDASNGFLYAVIGASMLRFAQDGTYTTLTGTVPGAGPVTMARNNKAPTPDIALVTSAGAFIVSGSSVVAYPDADLPAAVNSVTFLDGYFLWTTGDGSIWASDLNDTSVNPLSTAKAEAKPDGLLRGVVYGQQFFAFGGQTIEVWQDAGTSPFPLARSTVIPIGIDAPWTVSGYEPGWGGPIIFVARDNSVRSLADYTPARISNEDLERLIETAPDKTSLRASVYTFGGNSIYSLSSPTWTWEYNVTTGAWHERVSDRFTRWRVGGTAQVFGLWLAANSEAGIVYAIDRSMLTEGGYPLEWGMDSGPVKQFPSRIQVPGAAFDFVLPDSKTPIDPKVMISWSHDGGDTWCVPVVRSLARPSTRGGLRGRVTVNRMGLTTAMGFRMRFRMSDAIYTSFAGARMDAVDRK